MSTLLVFVELLAGSVWVGGLVAIGVATQSARVEVSSTDQIAFFRTLGRTYLRVGGPALILALVCGLVLLTRGPWDGEKWLAVIMGAALALITAVAVGQARALTRIRLLALQAGAVEQEQISRRVRRAGALRAGIGLLTLLEVVLAAFLTQQ